MKHASWGEHPVSHLWNAKPSIIKIIVIILAQAKQSWSRPENSDYFGLPAELCRRRTDLLKSAS